MNYRARGSGGAASMHRFFIVLSIEGLRIAADGRLLIGSTMTHSSATWYDDITINNSGAGANQPGGTGISLISNSASWGAIIFGDQDDNDIGYLKYNHNSDHIILGTSNQNRLIIDGSGRFNFGDNQTQTTYPFSVQWDLDSGGNLAYFANSDGTYNQGITLSFDSNKDIKWAGGSGSGGLIWNMGTRGYVWQIGGSEKLRIAGDDIEVGNKIVHMGDLSLIHI